MNKKLIAIAVASVMAAPVAMADIKISGRVGLDFTSKSSDNTAVEDSLALSDSGHTRLQFDGTMGNAYARIALDERYARDQTDANAVKRDNYLGYKWGSTSLQAGRMGGAAKNIEKDPYIGTFLETRSTVANSYTGGGYGSSSFINDVVQLAMKAGSAKIKIQFGPTDKANSNNGHIGASVAGKAGAVNYWASYNNGSADGNGSLTSYPSQSNIKAGGAMKFGKVKVSLNYTSMDKDGAVGANNATDSIFIDANMGFGNGLSGNLGYGTRSGDVAADDAEFIRLAVMKKINKGTSVYGGYTTTDYDAASASFDTDEFGVGMVVKF